MARNRANENENFYIMLELDFRKPEVDNKAIELAIKKKQSEWSKDSANKAKESETLQKLSFVNDGSLQRVMLPNEKDKDAVNARLEEAKAAEEIAKNCLSKSVCMVATAKGIKRSALDQIQKNQINKKYCPTSELLESICKNFNIAIIEDAKTQTKSDPQVEKLKKALGKLGSASVYDFFLEYMKDNSDSSFMADHFGGSVPTSIAPIKSLSGADIANFAKEASNYYRLKQSDNKRDDKCAFLGSVGTVFSNPERRKVYDDFMVNGAKEQLPGEVIDIIKEYAQNGFTMDSDKVLELMAACRKHNSDWDDEDIISLLQKETMNRKVNAFFPDISKGKTLFKECLLCGHVSPSSLDSCECCHQKFIIACPSCGKMIQNGLEKCTHCGFSMKNMELARNACNDAMKHARDCDYDNAQKQLDKAKNYWSKCPDIAKVEQYIKDTKEKVTKTMAEINSDMSKKYYFSAKKKYDQLSRSVKGFSNPGILSQIEASIKKAKFYFTKAECADDDEKEIVEACYKAKEECADFDEAIEMLNDYPPAAAQGILVTAKDSSVMVKWSASTAPGKIVYVVVRKYNSAPMNANDGDRLIETNTNYFEDTTVKSGVPVYYAVYVERYGIYSMATVFPQAVRVYAPVTNLVKLDLDRCVKITWKKPEGADNVEVWRAFNGGQATSIPLDTFELCNDRSVANRQQYVYSVYAVYRGAEGLRRSSAVTITAMPMEVASPITGCNLHREGGRFILSWPEQSCDYVEVYQSQRKLNLTSGTIKAKKDILEIASDIQTEARIGNSITFSLPEQGAVYLYPVAFNGDSGVFGDVLLASNIPEFAKRRDPVNVNNELILQLDWNGCPRATHMVVLYRTDAYPDSFEDRRASRIVQTKEQYAVSNCITIPGMNVRRVFFMVYAVIGEGVRSAGLPLVYTDAQKHTIYYEAVLKKGFGGKIKEAKVRISTEDGSPLPKLRVVKTALYQPLDITDGDLVANITDGGSSKVIILDPKKDYITEKTKFGVFLEEQSEYDFYKIEKRG